MDVNNSYVIVNQNDESEIMDIRIFSNLIDAEKNTKVGKTKAITVLEWADYKYDDGYSTSYG
jgi:hypothetical protein